MADGNIEIKTGINTSGIDKGIEGITLKLKKFGNSPSLKALGNIGATVGGAAITFKTVTTAIKVAKEAIEDLTNTYKVQAQAETQLTQAAKNNPYLLSESVTKLKNYASELQSISTYGDEQLLPFMAQLASAGRTEQEIMNIMSASIDVAASGAMSLDSAVKNLNKTFSGLSGELGEVNPQVKALSAEELKNGKAVEVLKSQYKGMAQEVAKATGTSQQLHNAIGDLKEELGAPFEKAMSPIRAFFSELIGGWASAKKARREYEEGIEEAKKGSAADNAQNSIITQNKERIKIAEKVIKALEKSYSKAISAQEKAYTKVTENGRKSLSDLSELDAQYYQQFVNATNSISAEIQKQERLINQAEEAINKAQTQKNKNADAEREAKKKTELQAEVAARDKVRDAYDATIAAKEKELALRRSAGEEISAEAEAQEMYNTAFAAYIKMMSDPAFKGNSGNFSHEANARSQIADWGKIAGGGELKKQIEDFEGELEKAADEAAGIVKNHYDSVLEALDEEYNAVIENKYLEEEEKTRIQEEYAEKRKKIEAAAAKADKDALTEKIDKATEANENYWTQYKSKIADLQKLEEEVEASTVLIHEEKEAEKTRIAEAATQARKELIANIANDVSTYTGQAVQIMQDASKLMLDTVKNQATAEQAELETKYRKGEISEEEYNKKVAESKKKAAKEQYKIQMWQWGASILQATANIAQGISMAIAQGGVAGLITGALVGAAGAVQIASIIASKPTPPSFSTGGIVGGSSYNGDNIAANLNSRGMVMNMGEQKALWDFINGGSNGQGSGANIIINNSASNIATVQPKLTRDKIEIMIDARVNDSLRNGRYDKSLTQAESGMSGDYYGI